MAIQCLVGFVMVITVWAVTPVSVAETFQYGFGVCVSCTDMFWVSGCPIGPHNCITFNNISNILRCLYEQASHDNRKCCYACKVYQTASENFQISHGLLCRPGRKRNVDLEVLAIPMSPVR